jgi:hypothetical protein
MAYEDYGDDDAFYFDDDDDYLYVEDDYAIAVSYSPSTRPRSERRLPARQAACRT